MGCIICSKLQLLSGLVVPDQEMAINLAERRHPFAQIELSPLFLEFSKKAVVGEISDSEFFRGCAFLGIDSTLFASGRYRLFLDSLRGASGMIQQKVLLLSCVLLAKEDFRGKMRKLLRIYKLENKIFSQREFQNIFRDLVHVCTVIMPKMSVRDVNLGLLEYYLTKIIMAESALIGKFRQFFYQQTYSWDSLLRVFDRNKEWQKLCWPNGVRLMLIQQDLKHTGKTTIVHQPLETDVSGLKVPLQTMKLRPELWTPRQERMDTAIDERDDLQIEGRESSWKQKKCYPLSMCKKRVQIKIQAISYHVQIL